MAVALTTGGVATKPTVKVPTLLDMTWLLVMKTGQAFI